MRVDSGKPEKAPSTAVRAKSSGPRIYQDGIHLIKEEPAPAKPKVY